MKKLNIIMLVALILNTLGILFDLFVLPIPEYVLGTVGIFFLVTLGTYLIFWVWTLFKRKKEKDDGGKEAKM